MPAPPTCWQKVAFYNRQSLFARKLAAQLINRCLIGLFPWHHHFSIWNFAVHRQVSRMMWWNHPTTCRAMIARIALATNQNLCGVRSWKWLRKVCDIYGERVVLDFNNKVGKDSTKKAKASFCTAMSFFALEQFFAQLWYISFDMKKCCLVVFFIWYVLARKRANSRWMSTKTWLTQCACGSGSGLSWPERWKLPTSRTWIGCLRVGTFCCK